MPIYGHTAAKVQGGSSRVICGDRVRQGLSPAPACPWRVGEASRWEIAMESSSRFLPSCSAPALLVHYSRRKHFRSSTCWQCPSTHSPRHHLPHAPLHSFQLPAPAAPPAPRLSVSRAQCPSSCVPRARAMELMSPPPSPHIAQQQQVSGARGRRPSSRALSWEDCLSVSLSLVPTALTSWVTHLHGLTPLPVSLLHSQLAFPGVSSPVHCLLSRLCEGNTADTVECPL